jgi:hypothetical protein
MLTAADRPRFFQALAAMGLNFSDELTKPRQTLYWQVFAPKLTIDEWEYACFQAIERENFHKVPLPAVLLDYVREYRRAQRDARGQQPGVEGMCTRQQLLAVRESLVDPAEVNALIASVWPDAGRDAVPVDTEARKALLREQARQVQDHG